MHFAGTLAGDVHNPKKSFPLVLLILVPVVFVQTVVPLALALGVSTDLGMYSVGFYSTLGREVAGPWLDVMITVGAIISQVGLTNGATLVSDEALQSFALRHNEPFFLAKSKSPRTFTRWFFDTNFRIAPVFALVDGALLMLLVWVCTHVSNVMLLLHNYCFILIIDRFRTICW